MTEENKENCNFQQNYNVFGLDDKPCCYLYHKYCEEIDNCHFKRCKRLEQENEMLTRENENRNDWIISLNKKCEELIKEKLNYRSALEEIRTYLNTLSSIDSDFTSTETYLRIQNRINEVLE